jgi:hypothetical protein
MMSSASATNWAAFLVIVRMTALPWAMTWYLGVLFAFFDIFRFLPLVWLKAELFGADFAVLGVLLQALPSESPAWRS